jgi:hypothetical protein
MSKKSSKNGGIQIFYRLLEKDIRNLFIYVSNKKVPCKIIAVCCDTPFERELTELPGIAKVYQVRFIIFSFFFKYISEKPSVLTDEIWM